MGVAVSDSRTVDGWMGGWVDGWMGGWVDGWMGGWVDGWMGRGLAFGQISHGEVIACNTRMLNPYGGWVDGRCGER